MGWSVTPCISRRASTAFTTGPLHESAVNTLDIYFADLFTRWHTYGASIASP